MGNQLSSAPQAANARGAQQDLRALLAAELPQALYVRCDVGDKAQVDA